MLGVSGPFTSLRRVDSLYAVDQCTNPVFEFCKTAERTIGRNSSPVGFYLPWSCPQDAELCKPGFCMPFEERWEGLSCVERGHKPEVAAQAASLVKIVNLIAPKPIGSYECHYILAIPVSRRGATMDLKCSRSPSDTVPFWRTAR
ncbi:hypothetical protein M407DRAFT_169806 [Tulasnella calospora MUT 4182]|uniref:Uncharacterized protein n=1 Tax=Tulasnella calospora MUT 4182 TaxID=1051891 RepID=A0A0C3L6E0_9AGAM|nr:hypothetical protein M407DRAFT_169806 [Tulasnella calospora MUT 4182]